MSKLEVKTYKSIKNIFSTISYEEGYDFDGYFASDMLRVNNQSCIYPCFIGFNGTTIIIVKVNSELEKEEIQIIDTFNLKNIKIRNRFLSKIIKMKICFKDSTSLTIGVPLTLKYIPTQHESVERFLKTFQMEKS